jgi:hypothetical protein
LLSVLLAVTCLSNAIYADDYIWTGVDNQGGNGNFDTAGWTDTDEPTPNDNLGPPGGGDFAYIPQSTILTCSGASVGTLDTAASEGGELDLTGSFSCNMLGSVYLTGGGNLTAGAMTTVSGAGVTDSAEDIVVVASQITAGSAEYPMINISAGGSLVIQSSVPQGEGIVTDPHSVFRVDGALTNFNGGAANGGTLSAGSIGSNNGLSGVISCDGLGSTLTVTGTSEFDGQGLRITGGGSATVNGNLSFEPVPSPFAGGGGSLYIDGAESNLTVSGNVSANANGVANGYGGTIEVSDDAYLHAGGLFLDDGPHAGVMDVMTGASVLIDTDLSVGGTTKGSLTMEAGGDVTVEGTGAAAIGFTGGSNGTVTADGVGTSLNFQGPLVAIGQDVGSTGSVTLTNGATMQVSGTSNYLHVGDSGTGTITVDGGSALSTIGANVPLEVGFVSDATGEIDVGGASPGVAVSSVSVAGTLVLGNQGSGTLNVSGEAMVAGDFFMGYSDLAGQHAPTGFLTVAGGQFKAGGGAGSKIGIANGTGTLCTIKVQGTGSALNFNGLTILGSSGLANMYVSGGGTAKMLIAELGASTGSTGQLSIYNPGSTVTIPASLDVGGLPADQPAGSGFVDVDDSALLTVNRVLAISATGQVEVAPNTTPGEMEAASGGRVFVGTDGFGPDGAVRVGHGGIFSGKGTQTGTTVKAAKVIGKVIVGAGGKFQPGGDPGFFTIDGDLDLSDGGSAKGGGEMDVEVASTGTPGTDYDEVITSGSTTLGGTLRLVLLEGYKPKAGDTLEIVKAKSLTGAFAEVSAPGLTLNPVQGSGKLAVKVTSVADVPAPVLMGAKTAKGKVGDDFVYQIEASGLPAGYAATNLPNGLDIDDSTGLISGIPIESGIFNVQLTSTSVGGTGFKTLELTIGASSDAPPVITVAPMQVDTSPKTNFSYQISASNTPASYGAAGLPAGLSLNVATGVISGKATQPGTYAIALSATNGYGTGTAALTLVVKLPAVKLAATVQETVIGGAKAGEFTVSIPFALPTYLKVDYAVTGSATPGVDYARIRDFVKIKAGKTSAVIKIEPRGDLGGASEKIVSLKLKKGAGEDYIIKTTNAEKVKILAR